MNQSKLEVITGSWRKARENACERVMIGFGCTSDWMKKLREFLSQSCSVEIAKPITFRHSNENRSKVRLCEIFTTVWQRAFPLWPRGFLLWTLTGGNGRERGLTGWTPALDWELARSDWSDSLVAGKELVTGSKVLSDLLQLESGHSENLDFPRLFFVLRCNDET